MVDWNLIKDGEDSSSEDELRAGQPTDVNPGSYTPAGSPHNRQRSPPGSTYACSVPTLSGHSSPGAQIRSPEPSGPYLLAYEPNERSVRNFMRLDKFNAKSTEGYLNPNMNNAATPVAFSREPTPPAPFLPHGYYYLAPQPQPAQSGSASPQTYPTPRASYTPSASRSGSASPRAYATSRSASYAPSASSSSYAADDELQSVSRRSASYRGSASPYYASSTTYSGSASPSYSISRASSASLTPEPEQHFQCPDCSGVFGSREVLNMHLRDLYYVGHCPAHH